MTKRKRKGKEKPEARAYQRHPVGVKQQAVERMRLGENVSDLARELGVHRTLLYDWRGALLGAKPSEVGELLVGDAKQVRIRELETKVAGLEGSLGRQTQELDFFGAALRRIKGTRPRSSGGPSTACTPKSGLGRRRKAGEQE